jgi:hypothetical protein
VQTTVKERVSVRFERELPHLRPLPAQRYDTSYYATRRVGWDAYVDVRGNRYSVPGTVVGQTVQIRISLDDTLRIYHGDHLIAQHLLRPASQGWVTVPEHHAELWQAALQVERRPLTIYAEVATWS